MSETPATEGQQGLVTSVAWSGDGRWLASGADDQTVCVWDMESGAELAVYQDRYSAYSLLEGVAIACMASVWHKSGYETILARPS